MTQRKMMRLVSGFMFALFALGFSNALLGQAVSGTLLGTVTDSTGKVVPNAQVTIVLTGQSTKYATLTNGSGDYTEPDLPSGTYSVTVAAYNDAGLGAIQRTDNIVVSLDERAREAFQLRELNVIVWVNPVRESLRMEPWLGEGAPAVDECKLGQN